MKIKTETKMFILGMTYISLMLVIGYNFTSQSRAYFSDVLKPNIVTETKEVYIERPVMELLKYNDQAPVELVKKEIAKQSVIFGNDVGFMTRLAFCESGFDNLADNKISTAKGIYQFIAGTWEVTESNKNKISEFDYKANIREAMIKIANGEYSHWVDCVKKIK